jgi:hypothetical protein
LANRTSLCLSLSLSVSLCLSLSLSVSLCLSLSLSVSLYSSVAIFYSPAEEDRGHAGVRPLGNERRCRRAAELAGNESCLIFRMQIHTPLMLAARDRSRRARIPLVSVIGGTFTLYLDPGILFQRLRNCKAVALSAIGSTPSMFLASPGWRRGGASQIWRGPRESA